MFVWMSILRCLFYRVYYVPTDNNIYGIFEYPTWSKSIKLTITYFNNILDLNTYRLKLRSQVRKRPENTMLGLTNCQFNTPSLLRKRFMSNNLTTSFLKEDTTLSYACITNPILSKDQYRPSYLSFETRANVIQPKTILIVITNKTKYHEYNNYAMHYYFNYQIRL
ncbi:hypothetical protein Y032_0007g3371 [Ancylostoma ceylanicum]|uniref:Phlebovirus glycoprotein G2 fusion domain-containing protein n=1 Tax=Ancylostoma ceylanicum TaxID=53326 RepID=A0A016VM77_9BILA|nr:hypothetical protein Y032_0007g3371 [Ancylostoma ceylanicum]